MRTTRRSAALPALLLAAGLALSGCASQAPAESDAPPPAGETAAPEAEKLTKENFAERVTAAQLEAGTVHVSQTIETGGQKTTYEGDMTVTSHADEVQVGIMISSPSGSGEVRLVDGVMYMNLGEVTGGKFMKFDGSDPSMLDPDEIVAQISPQRQMETFGEAIREFTVGGTEEIDGVTTTEYALVLDTETLVSGGIAADVDRDLIGDTVDYVMWVADDDLPRRATMSFSDTRWSSDYTRWGESVDIQAPAAGELFDLG